MDDRYGIDARERFAFSDRLERQADIADVVVELTPDQGALLRRLFDRLPDDGAGVIVAQVWDGKTADTVNVFLFAKPLLGENARRLVAVTKAMTPDGQALGGDRG